MLNEKSMIILSMIILTILVTITMVLLGRPMMVNFNKINVMNLMRDINHIRYQPQFNNVFSRRRVRA